MAAYGTIYNSQDLETAHQQMNRYKHCGTLFLMEYYTEERKKKEFLPFATAWMELETIMLSEISQSVKDKYHMISSIRGIQ